MHPSWLTPADNIRLRLAGSGPPQIKAIREAAFKLLTVLQTQPAEVQLQAVFALGAAMSETLNLDAHDLVVRARRQLADVDAAFTYQFGAIRDYAGNELRAGLSR